MLELKRIGLTVTFKCNLRCKLCGMQVPYYENPKHLELKDLEKVIDKFFDIIDYVENFEISGGETLLYPNLADVIEKVMQHKSKFDKITVYTNGTILPKDDVTKIMEKYSDICTLFVSHYGDNLSRKVPELIEWCEKNSMSFKVKKYYGEDLHCGGWVDFGAFDKKSTTYEGCIYLHDVFCPQLRNGELHMCGRSYLGMEKGFLERDTNEFIDLYDDSLTMQKLREKLTELLSKEVLLACYTCNGLCEDSPRYIPAEQL